MLPDREINAIKAVHSDWLEHELAGNAEGVLELCTEDAIWLPADGSILKGKAEIRRWLGEPGPPIKELRVDEPQIAGSGSFAYKFSTYSTSYLSSGSSELTRVAGTHLWILHKGQAGAWRVVLATWTSTSSEGAV